jgi:hypothetical protein
MPRATVVEDNLSSCKYLLFSHLLCLIIILNRWGIREGRGAAAEIDMALEGQTRLPQPGGIVKRQWVPPAIKTVSNAARSDSGSESGDSVTVDTTINAEVLA